MILFDSKNNSNDWRIVNDGVMGGKSKGQFKINDAGYIQFYGEVSLENNGGFCMIQHIFKTKDINTFSAFSVTLKGDGKTYQFRVKTNANDEHSYLTTFKTSGDWQIINIPFNQLEPKFRGKKLNMPNYSGSQIEMIGFLVGNKKAEGFMLDIESVTAFKEQIN